MLKLIENVLKEGRACASMTIMTFNGFSIPSESACRAYENARQYLLADSKQYSTYPFLVQKLGRKHFHKQFAPSLLYPKAFNMVVFRTLLKFLKVWSPRVWLAFMIRLQLTLQYCSFLVHLFGYKFTFYSKKLCLECCPETFCFLTQIFQPPPKKRETMSVMDIPPFI